MNSSTLKLQDQIIQPDTHSKLVSHSDSYLVFEDGSKFSIHNGTPVLFSKHSIFNEDDVKNQKATTQDRKDMDTSSVKNFVRRKMLPSLCEDFNIEKRYADVSKLVAKDSKVLIIGTGEKGTYYKNIFSHCDVITSDVHNEFKPDYIFDGHYIPFEDNCFDMILAAQVIEHTINPWKFCSELQRVVKKGGLLQIEAPQNYPYHAEPYDFFRFTYTGLRSLFPECEVIKAEITEGNAAMVAVTASNYLVNTSTKRGIRIAWLIVTRIGLGWLKYLDKLQSTVNRRTVSMPKGYAFTFKKDGQQRKPVELLNDFYKLKR